MKYQTKYANAYSEVYEILKYLDRDEYSKIPVELLEVIEKNRNTNYQYNLDKNKSLFQQDMLEGTKAILLNIFRDYIANPIQKSKIQYWQEENRNAINMKIQQNYISDFFQNINQSKNNKIVEAHSNSQNLPVNIIRESIISKTINKIKKFLKFK